MSNLDTKLAWGKTTDGTIHRQCVECGTSSKKHRGNGLCETCYGRAKDKRKRQRRKEQKQNKRTENIKELREKYNLVKELEEKQDEKIQKIINEEKKTYPLVTEYIDYLLSKLPYLSSFELVCPLCDSKYLYEISRAKKENMSSITHHCCPKCGFHLLDLEQLCWICQKRLMEWGEDICEHCKTKISKKTLKEFKENCMSCGNRTDWDGCHWSFPFEGDSRKMIQICDKCMEKINIKKQLASDYGSIDNFKTEDPPGLNWIKIENGEQFGIKNPYLSLLFLVPNYALQYLRKSNYRDKNFILNILSVSDLPLKGTDLTFSPPKDSFAGKYKQEILKRFDCKVLLWESSHNKNFVKSFLSDSHEEIILNDSFSKFHLNLFKSETDTLVNKKVIVKKPYDIENNLEIYSVLIKNLRTDEIITVISELLLESENEIRFENGIPEKGKGWVSESELFLQIKSHCDSIGVESVQHAKPKWLSPQHLDIFIPSKNIAIEYHGTQHFKPIDFFGGAESLKAIQERDKRKAEACRKNGVTMFYINEVDSSEENQDKISSVLKFIK